MDKTFNDLMDIVNRTKKLDGSDRPRPRAVPKPIQENVEEEYSPREYDIVEDKPKRKRTVKEDSPNLFAGSSVEKLLEKKTTKSATKKATTQKSTAKSSAKTTSKAKTSKKTATPKVSKPKLTKDDVLSEIQVKLEKPKKVIKSEPQPVDTSDPKNAQLYEALKNSLFSGGTDISEYMELQDNSEERATLQELKAKREAHKINEEITKEQQEYEQLFNGSFESQYQDTQLENFESDEEIAEDINVEEKNARLASELNAIRSNLAQKKSNPASINQVNTAVANKKDETYELETGNKDLDRKIAEYYKRKQEKINEYKAREEEGPVEENREQENGPVDYEAIFGGSMMTRDELLGIERDDEPQEVIEEVEEEQEEKISLPESEQKELEEISNSESENIESEKEYTENIQANSQLLESETEEEMREGSQTLIENEETTAQEIEEEKVEDSQESFQTQYPFNKSPIEETALQDDAELEEVSEPSNIEEVATETQEEKEESHIKSLLSDLLYSKKIYPTEEKKESETIENSDNLSNTNSVEENSIDTKADYESIWNETLMGGHNGETKDSDTFDNEESQEEVTNENTLEESQDEQEKLSDDELLDSLTLNLDESKKDDVIVHNQGLDVDTAESNNLSLEEKGAYSVEKEESEEENNLENAFKTFNALNEENAQLGTIETLRKDELENGNADIPQENLIDKYSYIREEDSQANNITQDTAMQEEEDSNTILDGQENFLSQENVPTAQSFENEEMLGIEEPEKSVEDIYDLSSRNADLDDYILSSNIPSDESVEQEDEQEQIVSDNADSNDTYVDDVDNNLDTLSVDNMNYDEHFESVVNNERTYENTQSSNNYVDEEDPEDNTCVVETLPENRYDLLGNVIEQEGQEEQEILQEEKKDDTISKEEFYNEMARLQENLINQLKGNATTESRDFFAEKDPEEEKIAQEQATRLVDDVISEYNNDIETQEEQIEPETEEISEVVEEVEPEQECKAEPVDPEHFDDYNLLGKEEPLNDEDLEFQEKSEEEKSPEKDAYFYLSPEDNEKKAQEVDEYMQLFNEDNVQKEVGDIHIFKTIGNASPSSEILKDLTNDNTSKKEDSEDESEEEIEAIYTLMGIERKPVTKVQQDMKVLYVASECQPFVASGGLGDVAGSLPKAIAGKGGVDIRVILPLYSSIKSQYRDKFEYLGNFTVHLSWRQEYCGLFRYYKDGVTYYFVDNERYFKRDKLYGYYDDGERFAYFSKAVVEALPYLNFFPDIIHCNDWQSSLVSAYIKTGNWSDFRYYKIKNIYTIHNVEYQGVYGMENLKDLFGIDNRFRNDMEYNGDINLTKAAIQYSDRFTTVSNSYCDNLKQPYCSRGLHHIIIRNEYKLSGIINGIDYDFYNPATDTNLFKNFDFGCIEDKVLNKKSWQDEMGLPVDGNTPMIAIVSRLVNHKGIDLIMKVIEEILDNDIQLVVVGTGDEKYVNYFKGLESKYPTKVRALVDNYSNENARKAYASSDIFLMPSKIEPCGISQMIASRYGCVPVVREVGGLKDTIKDFGCEGGGNGYTFTNYNPNDLKYQLNRAIRDYENKPGWREKMKICMSMDFTWNKPADEYIKLYKSLYETM